MSEIGEAGGAFVGAGGAGYMAHLEMFGGNPLAPDIPLFPDPFEPVPAPDPIPVAEAQSTTTASVETALSAETATLSAEAPMATGAVESVAVDTAVELEALSLFAGDAALAMVA
jgi:hypothetical protein